MSTEQTAWLMDEAEADDLLAQREAARRSAMHAMPTKAERAALETCEG